MTGVGSIAFAALKGGSSTRKSQLQSCTPRAAVLQDRQKQQIKDQSTKMRLPPGSEPRQAMRLPKSGFCRMFRMLCMSYALADNVEIYNI